MMFVGVCCKTAIRYGCCLEKTGGRDGVVNDERGIHTYA